MEYSIIRTETIQCCLISVEIINKYYIRTKVDVYRIFTWDDFYREICKRDNIGEVQKNQDGSPIPHKDVAIYASLDRKGNPSINQILNKQYIESTSPVVNKYIQYNNRYDFLSRLEEKRRKQEQEEEDWMSAAYDSYEEHRYDDLDLSPEEQVMRALENGEGEYLGY